MNDLTTFDFQNHAVRTVVIGGEPYWVARDVAEVLGYKDATTAVRSHCKGVQKLHPLRTAGGVQEVRVIGEPDLYRLIAHSNLPAAVEFEAWIFEEVLPTIRRTGSYDAGVKGPKRWGRVGLSTRQMVSEFRAIKDGLAAIGIKGNPASISADGTLQREYGVSLLGILQIELKSEDNQRLLLPSEISRILGWKNAHEVNLKLAELGLQDRLPGKKGGWRMTDKGAEYGVLIDTTKRHNNGAMVQQIKWKENVLLLLTEGFSA